MTAKKNKAQLLSLVIFSASLIASWQPVFCDTYYIHPTQGHSEASGGISDPYRSIMDIEDTLVAGDTVFLLTGLYEEKLTLTVKGTKDNPIVIMASEDKKAVIQGKTLRLEECSFLIIQNLTFQNLSPAIYFGENASDILVQNNDFIDCPPKGAGPYEKAILGQGPNSHRNRIIANSFRRQYEPTAGEGPEGMNVAEGNRHWVLENNTITGYMYGIQLGIGARGAPPAYITIANNEIFECHEGVHIKTADNIIRGNYIHDLERVGFMMAGCAVFLRSSPRTIVENNRIERAQGSGIRVMGNDHLIKNNLIINTPVGIWLSNHNYGSAGKSIWIVHNTVTQSVIPIWISRGEMFVYNNIFHSESEFRAGIFNSTMGISNPLKTLKPSWFGPYAGGDIESFSFTADYNIFENTKIEGGIYPLFPTDHKPPINNNWWGYQNVAGHIEFVAPEEGDYHLIPGSLGTNIGRLLPNCALDFNGILRDPEKIDVGAYQTLIKQE